MGSRIQPFQRKTLAPDAAADAIEAIQGIDILDGVLIEITLDGTTNIQTFPHGLERSYRGGFVAGDGSTVAANLLKVLSGKRALEASYDINAVVAVRPTGATSTTWLVWVF